MKTIYVLAMFFFAANVWSQQPTQKNDIIVLNNGQLLQAQVTRVTDNIVSYQYPGETVQNEIDHSNLDRIVYASGRTQDFGTSAQDPTSQQSLPIQTSTSPSGVTADSPQIDLNTARSRPSNTLAQSDIYLLPDYEENSLAVLPINYIKNSSYNSDLAGEATKFVASYLAQQAVGTDFKIQNVNNTVNNLIKSRIDQEQVQSASPAELLKVVNTQYAVKINISEIQKEKSKAPSSKEVVSSYFNQQAKADVDEAPQLEDDLSKISITLEVYEANGTKAIYDTTLSESRKGDQDGIDDQISTFWRSTLSYALNGYLNTKRK